MTDWPRGGYPAGDTPASELKPPPDSMISKSSLPATYTAAEVKVLTAKARQDAAEEIAKACAERARLANRIPEPERSGVREGMIVAWIAAEKLTREIGNREPA